MNSRTVLSNYLYCFEFVPSQSPLFQSLSMSKRLLSPQETVLALSCFTINCKSRHLIFISLLFTAQLHAACFATHIVDLSHVNIRATYARASDMISGHICWS